MNRPFLVVFYLKVHFSSKFQLIQALQNYSSKSKPGIYPLTVRQLDQLTLNAESPRQNAPVDNVPWNSLPVKEPPPHILPSNGYRCLVFALADLMFHHCSCSFR
jgi:hypothetical protein